MHPASISTPFLICANVLIKNLPFFLDLISQTLPILVMMKRSSLHPVREVKFSSISLIESKSLKKAKRVQQRNRPHSCYKKANKVHNFEQAFVLSHSIQNVRSTPNYESDFISIW